MEEQDLSKIIARIEKLEKAVLGGRRARKAKQEGRAAPIKDVDFSINERAFVRRYASGKSGPQKFAILLAYLVRGNVDEVIEIGGIKKRWDKISAKNLLGKFNWFYPNEAKTRGFVDSKEHGRYKLTNEWKNAL